MTRAVAMMAGVLALASCGDKDGDGGDEGGPGASVPCGDPCALTDDHNFTYATDLQFEVVQAQALADVCLDWSGLTTDIQAHPFGAEGIDEVRLAVFGSLSYDEIRAGLASDSLQQDELSLYMECHPDGPEDTDCCLAEFGLLDSVPGIDEYFETGSGSWLFTFGSEGFDGTRTLVMLEPSEESTTTSVSVGDATASLEMDVDLSSSTRALLPGGADLTVDWSDLTRDGLGNELAFQKINLLQLAHYDESPEELAASFFDLKSLATETWSMSVSGETSADLSELEGDTTFEGLSHGGTWLLALWCTFCENPVPKAIAVVGLDPEG